MAAQIERSLLHNVGSVSEAASLDADCRNGLTGCFGSKAGIPIGPSE
jgi:hypothetical protein